MSENAQIQKTLFEVQMVNGLLLDGSDNWDVREPFDTMGEARARYQALAVAEPTNRFRIFRRDPDGTGYVVHPPEAISP